MSKGRLEAFSDGVIAIIITIMVLELDPPHEVTLEALGPLLPVFLSYILSFVYLGTYWNNHHHLLQAAKVGSAPWRFPARPAWAQPRNRLAPHGPGSRDRSCRFRNKKGRPQVTTFNAWQRHTHPSDRAGAADIKPAGPSPWRRCCQRQPGR